MKYYDAGGGSYTLGAVGGTPPRARVGWSWGDYLILANGYDPSSAYALRNNRLWNSGVGNPDSWNTTASGGIFDMPDEVVGGVSMRNFQVVFGYSRVWAIAGDTPPPGSNWSRRDLFSVGCMDGRSIATYGDYFIWANNSGIYRSDGATTPTDVTAACGLSLFWRSLVSSFNFGTGWKAAAGVLYGCYVISITNAAGANVATLVFDLEKDVAFTVGNVYAGMFAQRYPGPGTSVEAGTEELVRRLEQWPAGVPAVPALDSHQPECPGRRRHSRPALSRDPLLPRGLHGQEDGSPGLPRLRPEDGGRHSDDRHRVCHLARVHGLHGDRHLLLPRDDELPAQAPQRQQERDQRNRLPLPADGSQRGHAHRRDRAGGPRLGDESLMQSGFAAKVMEALKRPDDLPPEFKSWIPKFLQDNLNLNISRQQIVNVLGENWRNVGDTNQPAYQNSWANFGGLYAPAGFRIDYLGVVHLGA
jgi:hypothetical protein